MIATDRYLPLYASPSATLFAGVGRPRVAVSDAKRKGHLAYAVVADSVCRTFGSFDDAREFANTIVRGAVVTIHATLRGSIPDCPVWRGFIR